MDQKIPENALMLYFYVISINLSAISMGVYMAWPSPSIPKLNGHEGPENNPLDEPLSTIEISWLASLLSIGAIFSPWLAFLADRYGRKKLILLTGFMLLIGQLLITFGTTVWFLYAGRLFAGFSLGLNFCMIPNYSAELSEKHNRGALSCLFKLHLTIGMTLIYCIGPYLSVMHAGLICLFPAVMFLVLVISFVPESPFYLVAQGNLVEAKSVLRKLRGRAEVEEEFLEMTKNVQESFESKIGLLGILVHRGLRKCLFITTSLAIFQQLSGVAALTVYLQTIFDTAGTNLPPEVSVILIGILQNICASITPIFIDKLGRKFFLYVCGCGTCVGHLFLGLYFHLQSKHFDLTYFSWLPLVCLIILMSAFTVGFGPIPWTILSEIFPPNAKAAAATFTISVLYAATFLTTMLFPIVSEALGSAITIWIFSAFCAVSVCFTKFFVPETKQKSFLEIQRMLNIHPKEKSVE